MAQAEGIKINDDAHKQVYETCRLTKTNLNSMLQDLQAGRRTEIPWLNGAIVVRAKQHGISVPANLLINGLVRYLEKYPKNT